MSNLVIANDLTDILRHCAWIEAMDRPEIIRTLKAHEAELRGRGVEHVALFGSVARGEGNPDSDIDIMLDLDPAARVTAFDYAEIVEYVRKLLGGRADVANRETLKPHVRPSAERDAVRAF
jgi:predicted nucleotidyltransferase